MTYNAAERSHVRKAEKSARAADVQRTDVIRQICDTEPGRRYLWDSLAESHIFATSFSTDPLQMAFAEGERNRGLRLLNDIVTICPDKFLLMMQESNTRATASEPKQPIIEDEANALADEDRDSE